MSAAQSSKRKARASTHSRQNTKQKTSLSAFAMRSPSQSAKEQVETGLAPLQACIKQILHPYAVESISLVKTIKDKETTIDNLEKNKSKIPKSAKIQFTLTASEAVSKLPKFIALKEESDAYVKEAELELKKFIIEAQKLQLKNLRKSFAEHCLKTCEIFTDSHNIWEHGDKIAAPKLHYVLSKVFTDDRFTTISGLTAIETTEWLEGSYKEIAEDNESNSIYAEEVKTAVKLFLFEPITVYDEAVTYNYRSRMIATMLANRK